MVPRVETGCARLRCIILQFHHPLHSAFASMSLRAANDILEFNGLLWWLHAPMESKQLLSCLREVLFAVCAFQEVPFSVDEANCYDEHSARHTLCELECANTLGELATAWACNKTDTMTHVQPFDPPLHVPKFWSWNNLPSFLPVPGIHD